MTVGSQTLYYNSTGSNNVALSVNAGSNITTGSGNVFIGANSGTGETGSNKLYIANTATASPLIYGDFSAGFAKINGSMEITGRIIASGIHNNGGTGNSSNGAIASGTYTPTITAGSNIDSTAAAESSWTRVGNVVTVSGVVQIDPTTASNYTSIGISLPVAANLALATELSGTCARAEGPIIPCMLLADSANDRAEHSFTAGSGGFSTSSVYHTFTFQYWVH